MARFFKLHKIMNPLSVKYNKKHQNKFKETDTKTHQVILKQQQRKILQAVRGGQKRKHVHGTKDISGYPGGNGENWGQDRTGTKGYEETFKGDGYVHYLDCDDGFTGTYIYQNVS